MTSTAINYACRHMAHVDEVIGYGLARGVLAPSNAAAQDWLEMAAFDRLKRATTRSYQRIMLDIPGVEGDFPTPELRVPAAVLALHVATAVADFGGLIDKIATEKLDCPGCYGDCAKVANCMTLLEPAVLVDAVVRRLGRPRR